jgi:hypothetical protein
MIAFSLAKYRPLTAEKLLKFMFPLIISGQSLVLGTGQKSLLLYPMEVFRNQRCNSFFLSYRRRSTFI